MLSKTILITLFSALALAAPITPNDIILSRSQASEQISAIAPSAPNGTSCDVASYKDECRTAAQAEPYLIKSMASQGINTYPEIGALIALMAYESGDFKYNIHHFPSLTPGQGTRNMQMAKYNLLYAQSIPALKEPLAKITTASSTDGLSDDALNQILALVTVDEYTWGSAGWFLISQCSPSVRTALQKGDEAGWQAYLSCVGVKDSDYAGRTAYWTRAKKSMPF